MDGTPALPHTPRPPRQFRDCSECKRADAMKLQNVARTNPVNIPLLYVCQHCGTMFTIPPPEPVTE
jgi:hypothetical protein